VQALTGDQQYCWKEAMRPTISRSELGQFLRLLFVAALLLAGIGVAIGGGSTALELIAMR
jgi:hypothetical protein